MRQPIPDREGEIGAIVAERMGQLRQAYLKTLKERAAEIEHGLRQCEAGALDPDMRHHLNALAHKLAGTGATHGFADLSVHARRLDEYLRAVPGASGYELRDLVAALLVACRAALGLDEMRNVPSRRAAFGRRTPPEPAPLSPVPRSKPKLLVVDDDPAVRDLFRALLDGDADVVTAVNSDEALRMMRLHRPVLVLLDDIMPGAVTGLRFLETLQISGEFSDTPIVMVTASSAPEHIERGFAAGAAGYITKPFDAARVIADVRGRLGLSA